jgi:putative transposase
MSRYRRDITPGGTFFFTLVSYRRQPILCDVAMRDALRRAIVSTREKHPFTVDAWVLMPDHLHCIWTLPEGDADYAKRWGQIKRRVSRECGNGYKRHEWLSMSKQRHRESTLWQRRYWEHRIRDEKDFAGHMDYIHYNPVKHGLCARPDLWPWTTLHRYIREGVYPQDWAGRATDFNECDFGE